MEALMVEREQERGLRVEASDLATAQLEVEHLKILVAEEEHSKSPVEEALGSSWRSPLASASSIQPLVPPNLFLVVPVELGWHQRLALKPAWLAWRAKHRQLETEPQEP